MRLTAEQLRAEFKKMLGWKYEWGAARKGVVDCSGAFVYAMKLYGLPIAHGSNSIRRYWLTECGKIGEIDLVPGMAVFKWREVGEPDKFIADGLDDFFHIGLYIGSGRVLEAKGTDYGFVEGTLSDGWDYAGKIKGIVYQEGGDNGMLLGTVIGGRLRLRSEPSLKGALVDWLEDGSQVEVMDETDDAALTTAWLHVRQDGTEGYALSQYIKLNTATSAATGGIVGVYIPCSTEQAPVILALLQNAKIING